MIEFFDPRAAPGTPVDAYELSIDLGAEPVTIGLLANGFPDSVAFLDHIEKSLAALVPSARFARYDKGNASAVVSDQMLGEIVAECRAVVAAYGH
jgi:hypothetical protein